ncbi:MAG: pyridoxal kinase PdxY [Treponema sp.]|nr:pyridoxal kinase PdxY [Treponema sp.]
MAILSIQSHVAYGHAGNSAAVFPLQRMGRDVWAVNTVEFSNHTGYGSWRGKVLDAGLAEELVAGIEDRGVLRDCEAVLSGYMGDAGVGRAVMAAVQKVKALNPAALYCCDPVMGDVGRGFYVHADIPGMFKNETLPMADIATPNQFELEALAALDTSTLAAARKAIDIIHAMGPRVVLVTSYREQGGVEDHIEMLASDGSSAYRVRTPELPLGAGMAGSGDVTAALFLSRYLETGSVRDTLELTAGSIFGVMDATFKAGSRELLLIASQEELVKPRHVFKAEKL